MSEVISFRLNKDNPREVKALLVLQTRKARGYSVRQIVTEALLKLDQNGGVETDSDLFGDLGETLCQVNHLLKLIKNGKSLSAHNYAVSNDHIGLSASFVDSVKNFVPALIQIPRNCLAADE